MVTFYYTTRARDIRPNMMEPMALLFCAISNMRKPTRNNPARIQVPRLPPNALSIGADPGGFLATLNGGVYPYRSSEYMIWLNKLKPAWAGTRDLCCVDIQETCMPGKNGKKDWIKRAIVTPPAHIIQERQDFTTEEAEITFNYWPDTDFAWVPTIQGFSVADYQAHARALKPLIHQMWTYYQQMVWLADDEDEHARAEQRSRSFRVGIGSLVGRATPGFVREVVLAVQSVLGDFIPIHLWGVKKKYLKALQQLVGVTSYDTAAFNNLFGEDHEPQKQSGLSQANYVWQVAQQEYDTDIQRYLKMPQHQLLFPDLAPPPEDINLTCSLSVIYNQLA